MQEADRQDRLTRWTIIGLAALLAAGLLVYVAGFLHGAPPPLHVMSLDSHPVKHP